MPNWVAPRADGPVHATVSLPGSKSLTNRLLVLAALADAPSRIAAPLRARDTELMASALRTLGTSVTEDGTDWLITPAQLHAGDVDCGLAGTVMRFVPPLAALATGPVTFDGDPYARERPMATLLTGLRQAGAVIEDGDRGRLPFTVRGTGAVPGGRVTIDASASSQFVSGLLLAAARYDKGIEIAHTGNRAVPSEPHLAMTLDVLHGAGVTADSPEPGVWTVAPGPISGGDYAVEPDLSNAAPFLAAAALTGGSVTVPGWPAHTTQPGAALPDILTALGADVHHDRAGLTVRGTGHVAGYTADLRDVSELVTIIAALAACADGPSTLTGLAHMRGHETDRLAALHAELTGIGCGVEELADGLVITPRPLRGALWHAYADHRMATAGALLGLVVDGIEVDDIAATTKTLPDFPGLWSALIGR